MGHKHGGGWKGGGGFAPYYGGPYGYGWGYPIQYGPSEVFVVDSKSDADKERALAYVMSLPKNKRATAYTKLFGKEAPASVLGDWPPYQYQNAGGMALSWKSRTGGMSAPWTQPYEYRSADTAALGDIGGIFEKNTLDLPMPGKPEVMRAGAPLGDCGCGCNGNAACRGVGEVDVASLAKPVAIGVGVFLLYKHFAKKKRR